MASDFLIDSFIRLQEKLHRVACGFLRDDPEADDAVQDAFCNLWSRDSPGSSREADAKLFTTLKNVCINKIHRRQTVYGYEELPDAAVSPPDVEEFDKIKPLLLSCLSPLQRRVFEMSVFDDMEYEEIAVRLEMNIEAVRQNMSRARKKVREQYKKLQR